MKLCINAYLVTLSINDIQYKQHSAYKQSVIMLSVLLFIVMLNIIMIGVVATNIYSHTHNIYIYIYVYVLVFFKHWEELQIEVIAFY
jgi:hypothetical protein